MARLPDLEVIHGLVRLATLSDRNIHEEELRTTLWRIARRRGLLRYVEMEAARRLGAGEASAFAPPLARVNVRQERARELTEKSAG